MTSEDQSSRRQLDESVDQLVSGKNISNALRDSPDDEPLYTGIDRYRLFRFAQFVKYARRNDPELLNRIVTFAKFGFVFRVVRGFAAAPQIDTGDSDLTLVLDGPVLIDLLGLSGATRKEAAAKIVELAKKVGMRPITLTHCVEEAVEVISTILGKQSSDRWGLTGDALRRNPPLESRFRSFTQMPDKMLEAAGISVAVFDKGANPNSHGYFSNDLLDDFASKAHFGGFNSTPIRRERDALSFAFVARRRGATYKSDLFKSKYVLVTQNSTYASLAQRFVKDRLPGVPKFASPYVIEVSVLAALLWLRVSSDSAKTLPGLQLFATCQRLLASSRDILQKAKSKLGSGSTDEERAQYELLLSDPLTVEELVVRDAKNTIAVSEPDELRAAVKQAAIEQERRRSANERRRLKKEFQVQISELSAEVDEAKSQIQTQSARADEAAGRNSAVLQTERQKLEQVPGQITMAFDMFNFVLFAIATLIGLIGFFGLKELLVPSPWYLALPAAILALSAILRAPLVGPSIRFKMTQKLIAKRQCKLASSISVDWVRETIEGEFGLK